jgi:phage tail P2-like protein
MNSLLSPGTTALERDFEASVARIGDVPVPLTQLWDPASCPLALLPWLAWALSVDEWDSAWPESVKRQVVARSAEMHRKKGTPWAVRAALVAQGYEDVELHEGLPAMLYDGSDSYAGVDRFDGEARWAVYRIVLDLGGIKPLTEAERARIRASLSRVAPLRCHLRELAWRSTVRDVLDTEDASDIAVALRPTEVWPLGLRYDGSIAHDQAQVTRHDATKQYDAAVLYTGRHGELERYDTRTDELDVAVGIVLADSPEAQALYNGTLYYGGVLAGPATSPLDGVLRLALTRWTFADGARTHDGSLTYTGKQVEVEAWA